MRGLLKAVGGRGEGSRGRKPQTGVVPVDFEDEGWARAPSTPNFSNSFVGGINLKRDVAESTYDSAQYNYDEPSYYKDQKAAYNEDEFSHEYDNAEYENEYYGGENGVDEIGGQLDGDKHLQRYFAAKNISNNDSWENGDHEAYGEADKEVYDGEAEDDGEGVRGGEEYGEEWSYDNGDAGMEEGEDDEGAAGQTEEEEQESSSNAWVSGAGEEAELDTVDECKPYTVEQINRQVKVRKVPNKGRCLFARKAFSPGEIIMVEKPILVSLPSLNEELWELLTAIHTETPLELPPRWHQAALCSLTMLDEEGIAACLEKWVPDPNKPPSDDVKRIIEYFEDGIDPVLYERLLQVWRFNCFGHHTDGEGLVMYNRISMMAHSCKATGCWHYADGDNFVLRARTNMPEGGELTISYIGDEELLKSTDVRRETAKGWLFTCQCLRCEARIDPARGFRCPSCGIGAMHFKTEVDGEEKKTFSAPCNICGVVPDDSVIENYLEFERAYLQRLPDTSAQELSDALNVYEEACRVFAQHWILYELQTILVEGFKTAGDSELASQYQLNRISYVQQVMPWASYTLAWMYEEMADLTLQNKDNQPTKECVKGRLKTSAHYILMAYNLMYILCGPSHDYSLSLAGKHRNIEGMLVDGE